MKVCPRCFESNDASAEFCSDCGAPFQGTEGSDQEVYRDLAKANLLRMRGDMKAANDVCLGILRRFPNNPTAHSLLGDIWADQGDLQQAANWYEMALDLAPDSSADRSKLDGIQERLKSREAAETALQIGIPQNPTRPWPFLTLLAVTVAAVGIGAFFLGRAGLSKNDQRPQTIETPVTVPKNEPEPNVKVEQHQPEVQPGNTGPRSQVSSDEAILTALQTKGKFGVQYVSAQEDPRSRSVVLTVRRADKDGPSVTALQAGLEFFRVFSGYGTVTVRIAGDTMIVYVADLTAESAKTVEEAVQAGATLVDQTSTALTQTWSSESAESRDGTGN